MMMVVRMERIVVIIHTNLAFKVRIQMEESFVTLESVKVDVSEACH